MRLQELLKDVLPQGKFWTDAWSLVEGCTPVSPGCAHCWLAGMSRRNLPNMTSGLTNEAGQFNGTIRCREDRLNIPLRKKKSRVFAVWSDLFHEDVPDDFRVSTFEVIARATQHHFIIITKRAQGAQGAWMFLRDMPYVVPNVTILVTMEDEKRMLDRINDTINISAMGWRVGILAEPLLSAIYLYPELHLRKCINGHIEPEADCSECPECGGAWAGSWLSWIITGGESGHGARPAHPDWFRSLRNQAQAAGVPFVFKQWGEWAPSRLQHVEGCVNHTNGQYVHEFDPTCDGFMRKLGKKAAGRTLDGREWLEVPEVA